MPKDLQAAVDRSIWLAIQEAKASKRKTTKTAVPAGKKGTLFAQRNKRLAIREAAMRTSQIAITYKKTTTGETNKYIVAPYSWRYRRLKVGNRKMLYAYDMESKKIKSFALANIKKVAITDRKFRPKWTIEIT